MLLFGMTGGLLALGVFWMGWRFGRTCRAADRPTAETPDEQERQRLLAEQQAFRALMHYSPEIAYGEQREG